MKRFLLLIAWTVFAHSAMTQTPDTTLEQRVLHAMSQLSYDSLVTGIHIDRAPQYLPIRLYDGTWPSDSVEVSWNALSMLYGMLAWSQVDTFPLPLIDSTLSEQWHQWDDHDTLLIGGLWMRYDRFKPWALDSNLVTWDGSYFQTVSGAASPFEQDNVFALCMADDVRYGLTQIFYLHPDWFYTNHPGGWTSLEMDAGDGLGWRSVAPGDVLTIQYTQEGLRYVDFRIVMAQGDTLMCTASMDVRAEDNFTEDPTRGFGDAPDEEIHLGAFSTWSIWQEYTDKCGKKQWKKVNKTLPAGLTAAVFYNKNCATPALRKPLFLVNGFDPARSYNWEYVMGDEGLLKFDYDDPSSPPKLLSDHLHDEQYDIIYVTFSDATGDIRTNAGWLRQLIEQVNAMKAAAGSQEKNVVIGASMGGLISKWALLTMQNDEVDHETELFMTVDSPLRGAHIPLGMQALVKNLYSTKFFGNPLRKSAPVIDYNHQTLNSAGARQMLFYNWTTVDQIHTNGPALNTEHDEFFTEFKALGQLSIPHIAISNGAINGTGNSIVPGELLLHFGNLENIESLINSIYYPCAQQNWLFNPFLHFLLEYKVYASPGTFVNVFPFYNHPGAHLFLRKEQKIFDTPIWELNTYTATNIVSYDHVPGGLRSFNGQDEATGQEEEGFDWTRKSFCFIPTFSSLDLNTNDPFYAGINLLNPQQTIESGKTPLRQYIGSVEPSQQFWQNQTNQEHVTFDRRTANFVKAMLKNIGLKSTDNPLTNRTFNFGNTSLYNFDPMYADPLSTRRIIDFDLTIEGTGQLWIHRDDRISFTDVTTNPLCSGEGIFEVNVTTSFCDDEYVIMDVVDGGQIKIGDIEAGIEGRLIFNNNTELQVNQGGSVLFEEGFNNNLILDGGQMIINNGGFVHANWGSRILVKEGSTLKVKTGGILRISTYSALEVEQGGRLILEPGAVVQLWDGQQPNGAATIHIRDGGTLEWQ